jgi:hypothetical protein
MANARVRLSQQTIDAVSELGQLCGIDDHDTVIKLLIRKYGDQLASLLAPDNPNTVRLSQSVPTVATPDPILASTVPNVSDRIPPYAESIVPEVVKSSPEPTIAPKSESPADELARLRALKPMERMKHSARITELKELLEA